MSHPSIYNKVFGFDVQRFLFSGLSFRLKAVREIILNTSDMPDLLLTNNLVLSDIEKFNLVFNLRATFCRFKSLKFYLENVQAQCFLFSFCNIYEVLVEVIWNNFFSTVLEFNVSNHNSSIFRPFRNSEHSFLILKALFLRNKFFTWNLRFRFVSFLELSSSNWLWKNFPVKSNFLGSWLKKYSMEGKFQLIRANLIFISLVSFLINGLV